MGCSYALFLLIKIIVNNFLLIFLSFLSYHYFFLLIIQINYALLSEHRLELGLIYIFISVWISLAL
jgi:hypothetical protein